MVVIHLKLWLFFLKKQKKQTYICTQTYVNFHTASVESSHRETFWGISFQASQFRPVCEDQHYNSLQQLWSGPGQSLGHGECLAAQGENMSSNEVEHDVRYNILHNPLCLRIEFQTWCNLWSIASEISLHVFFGIMYYLSWRWLMPTGAQWSASFWTNGTCYPGTLTARSWPGASTAM